MTISYTYQALGNPERDVQLLKLFPGTGDDILEGNLVQASLATTLRYDAVSYTWNSPPFEHYIMLDEYPFPIGFNLCAALKELRRENWPRYLWIDALSINQDDFMERRHQVRHMREIFMSARQVLAWLGDASDDSDIAIDFVSELTENDIHEASNCS
jgi:hypothetical protein